MSATFTKTGRPLPRSRLRYTAGMNTIDYTQINSLLPRLTREQFERQYAENSRLTLDEFHRWLVAVPCACAASDCQGWQAIPMRTWKREQREARKRQ